MSLTRAAVRAHHVPHDGSPSPVPPLSREPRGVHPVEPVEDPLAFGGGQAGAVVGDA